MADGYLEEHGGQVQPDTTKGPQEQHEQDIVAEVRSRFALVKSIESTQRTREQDELEFVDEEQWTREAIEARSEHIDEASGSKVPARPRLTVNLIKQPIQQILGEARDARATWTVRARGGAALETTAGYYKGLLRTIQNDSGAMQVRLWALNRTAKVGRGAYRVTTGFANDGDFDLDVMIERILDQDTVYWDPHAQGANYADADWCLIKTWMSKEERLRRWPDKPIIAPDGAFADADDPWFATDSGGDDKSERVSVGDYFRVTYAKRVLAYHPAIGSMPLDEMPEAHRIAVMRKEPGTRTRDVEQRQIKRYFVDGSQVLEEHEWNGRFIPIIPTVGEEYIIKGRRRCKGEVRDGMDAQRGYNVSVSSAVEAAAKVPRMSFLVAEGQDRGYEDIWDQLWTANYTRVPYVPTSLDGKPVAPPQPMNWEPALQGLLLLGRTLKDDAATVSGYVDPSLRAMSPYDRSGEAIKALQAQGRLSTSNYLDNLAQISMAHEGRVILDLIPKIYDRPGRKLYIAREDRDGETPILIKVPFTRDERGEPVPVPCPHCQGTGKHVTPPSLWPPSLGSEVICPQCQGTGQATRETMPPGTDYNGQPVEYVDFSEGEYKLDISITKATRTKQEEALAAMSDLATAAPDLVPTFAAQWVRAMDFKGASEIAEALEKMNPANQQQAQELTAQVQQLQAQLDAMTQAFEEARRLLDGDVIKSQSNQAIAQMKAEATRMIEEMKLGAKLDETRMKTESQRTDRESAATVDSVILELKANFDRLAQENQQRHEILMQLLKQSGTAQLAEQSQTAAAIAADRDREATREEQTLRPEVSR